MQFSSDEYAQYNIQMYIELLNTKATLWIDLNSGNRWISMKIDYLLHILIWSGPFASNYIEIHGDIAIAIENGSLHAHTHNAHIRIVRVAGRATKSMLLFIDYNIVCIVYALSSIDISIEVIFNLISICAINRFCIKPRNDNNLW